MTTPERARARAAGAADPVATVDWPTQRERRAELAATGRPRLLVVAAGQPPPEHLDSLEDWIREPIEPIELITRLDELRRRYDQRGRGLRMDDDGLLHVGRRWVALTPVQQTLVRPLLGRVGTPVPLGEVQAAYEAAGGPADPRPLHRALSRLRGRLAEIGVRLHVLSGRAVLLESPSADSSHRADQTGNLHETSTHDPDARSHPLSKE